MLPPPRSIRWIISLAVFFLAAMAVMRLGAYYAFSANQVTLSRAWPAFWLGFRFDARVVAAALLPALLLGGIPGLRPFRDKGGRRFWVSAFSVFSALLIALYVVDYLHFRYLNQRLNASVLGFLTDAGISARMAWESYPVIWIGIGMALAGGGAAWAIARLHGLAAAAGSGPERRAVRATWSVAAVLLCLLGIFGRASQYPLRWSDAYNLRSEAAAHLALNPVESFLSSLSFRTSSYEVAKVRQHYAVMSDYLGVNRPDASRLNFERVFEPAPENAGVKRRAGVPPPNVVLVICESFSAYKSTMWGNPLDTTPFFNSLTREGVFFENCYTPHFGTARGVWATITGIPDVGQVETASRNPAMVDQHTIINDFTGYEKLYFLGGSTSWANIRGVITANIAGLKLYEEDSYEAPRVDVWGISDKELFLAADRVLRAQTQPFFAVIQTSGNHRPYTIPKEDLKDFTPADVPASVLKRNGFESLAEFNAFRYTDFSFQRFFTAARQSPYFDNTLFVFIGDHGISGHAGTLFPDAWTAQRLTCYHVPLLFYAPKLLAPQRISAVASMVDLLPTLAGLVGIPYRNSGMGRDLLRQQQKDGGRDNLAFVIDHNNKSIGVIKGSYYGIEQPLGSGKHELVWADFRRPAPAGSLNDARAGEYNQLAQAVYETSRYLLLNNKKPAPVKGAD
ncbi:MAG: hypothetical protein RIQ93_245 [Verrucomicrobiota bacterium]|jgi:phosphoglycerol transferase MdoB-like AlkP superfamily enzyme